VPRPSAPVTVFAIEDDRVQLTWPWWPDEDLAVEVGPGRADPPATPPALLHRRGRRPLRLGHGALGPGAVTLDGLDPATRYDITVAGPRTPRRVVGSLRTLPTPAGACTARFATLNDIHLGERAFGGLKTIVERTPLPAGAAPYPERAARAALAELEAWGAGRVVVKGDLTRDSEPVEFREAGRLLAGVPLPVDVVLGNHDVRHGVDGPGLLAGAGVDVALEARAFDLPGLRVVLAHTPLPSERRGRLGRREMDRVVSLVGDAPGAALVALHHAPQRLAVPTHYPPGLYYTESRRFLARMREANPALVVVAGHTHRNRTDVIDGVPVVEVGSTKDHPGCWAGYVVHEGGLRQVVRRIAEPSVLAWTEATGHALRGVWGRWSVGTLSDRCWSRNW
jgi:Icc protein